VQPEAVVVQCWGHHLRATIGLEEQVVDGVDDHGEIGCARPARRPVQAAESNEVCRVPRVPVAGARRPGGPAGLAVSPPVREHRTRPAITGTPLQLLEDCESQDHLDRSEDTRGPPTGSVRRTARRMLPVAPGRRGDVMAVMAGSWCATQSACARTYCRPPRRRRPGPVDLTTIYRFALHHSRCQNDALRWFLAERYWR
jgi:hypothetical protein